MEHVKQTAGLRRCNKLLSESERRDPERLSSALVLHIS